MIVIGQMFLLILNKLQPLIFVPKQGETQRIGIVICVLGGRVDDAIDEE
ncbi:hypothetical protein [Vibrio coralliirubri]|nr:hypothetical protein [Vibrio coralliirubri]